MSAGERIPSSKRLGASVISVVCRFSEEFDFVIGAFGFDRFFLGRTFLRRLEFLYYGLSGAVASNDFNLLLGVGKTFPADFYQLHPFLVADDHVFEWQFARLHLLDNFLEPIHRALKVQLRLARLRFTTHGENGGIKHSFATRKGRLPRGRTTVASAVRGGRAFDRAKRLCPEDRTTRQKTLVDSENKRLAPVSSSANVHFRISGRCAYSNS